MVEELPARWFDNSAIKDGVSIIGEFDDAESCRLNTGINSKDPHKSYFLARISGNFLFIYIKVGPDMLNIIMIF
jgi:hypothetical protein